MFEKGHQGYTRTHGYACRVGGKSKTYRTWQYMKKRCFNKNDTNYKNYGGRGITVCVRWMMFENFLEDMGEMPIGHSLDRFPNNDGNYEPSNCRWATKKQQSQNTRRTRLVTFDGVTMCIKEWATTIGISPKTLTSRINAGWKMSRALGKEKNEVI